MPEPVKGSGLYKRVKARVPGGTQLLSKRPEMFLPERWPSYYASAKGVVVVDLDGNGFIGMTIMGIGACILGYADPHVDDAAKRAIDNGAGNAKDSLKQPLQRRGFYRLTR